MGHRPYLSAVASGIGAALVWGGFPVISKLGLEQSLGALDITALRYLVAGLILLPVLISRGFQKLPVFAIAVLVCGAGAPYLLLAVGGLQYAPASHFGIIGPGSMLLFSALGGRLWQHDRFSAMRILGMVVIVSGILVLGWEGLFAVGENIWIGDLMFAAAGLFWSGYTLAARHWHVEPLHSIAIVSVLSMVLFVPPYLLSDVSHLQTAPPGEILLQAVFQGLFSATLALLFYTRAVFVLGAARAALFAALVPAFACVLSIPVLGEFPTSFQLIGVALVTIGMILGLGLRPVMAVPARSEPRRDAGEIERD
ncbi:MAG: DMT family transporter [Spirochaetales bacterium]|nr:DMT family transporter [Spirochaetales bacterium]MCP5486157.1 DMT family transporter [Spirochaetales bacterium]